MPFGRNSEQMEFVSQSKGGLNSYQQFLKGKLKEIHKGVSKNIVEAKIEDKQVYDSRHKAVLPSFYIGQNVLLRTFRPDIKNNKILTYRPYTGPYIITGIFESDACGAAYRLVEGDTGKPLRRLITGDRLKAYHTDPQAVKLPMTYKQIGEDKSKTKINKPKEMIQAKSILKQAGKNYLVLFADDTKGWTSQVSEGLLKQWRLKQDEERLKRRQNRSR